MPHADPAPWAGKTRVTSGRVRSLEWSERYSWRAMALCRSFSRRRLGRQQVGAAHVPDEEGVAGKDSIGHLVAAVLVDHEAH